MQHHTRGIDDWAQGRPFQFGECLLDPCNDIEFRGSAGQNLRSRRIDGPADFGDYQRAREMREASRKLFNYFMDGRKFAEFVRIAHEFDGRACV